MAAPVAAPEIRQQVLTQQQATCVSQVPLSAQHMCCHVAFLGHDWAIITSEIVLPAGNHEAALDGHSKRGRSMLLEPVRCVEKQYT